MKGPDLPIGGLQGNFDDETKERGGGGGDCEFMHHKKMFKVKRNETRRSGLKAANFERPQGNKQV